jgi:phage head maturation protease
VTLPWLDDAGEFVDRATPQYARKLDEDGNRLGWLLPAVETKRDDETRATVTRFVASTDSVDRVGDVVEQTTWRLANWRRNPVILHEHAPPVVGRGKGRVTDIGDERRGLVIDVTWDESDHNPVGQMLADQHRNGFRFASSVGFRPGQAINRRDLDEDDPRRLGDDVPRWRAGNVFRFNELLELSSVAVPANPDALQLSLHAREQDDPEQAIRAYLEANTDAVRQLVLDAVRNDDEIRSAVKSIIFGAQRATTPTTKTQSGLSWLPRRA